ncbi:hypothetical protein [Streptomyces sp. NPDC048637]|uniref:hypothetical protein n=1 Tax=Streptomyces sp. NPDC048637 TaxID=3155636 RepID=UPI003416B8B1
MNPYRTAAAMTAELITAAEALAAFFDALKSAGFSEAQAFALVRDVARTGGAQ